MPWKECHVMDEPGAAPVTPLDFEPGSFRAAVKCRFVKARPDPDFRYFSKRTAASSVGNSMETTRDHGRWAVVWPHGPWLCHSRRAQRSLVIPT